MKILSIVETAFRGTIEEQDDTVVWATHAMKRAGQDFTLLLRGNAVCHAVRGQDASGLTLGAWSQQNPVDLAGDLQKLMADGVPVVAVRDDLAERGLEGNEVIEGVSLVGRRQLASLLDDHDLVWHW